MVMTTLCYLEQGEQYLMLHRVKKEQDLNKDKWIGIGGKFELGESPEECVRREALEETGLSLSALHFRGIITFVSDKFGTEYMHLFTCDSFSGQPHPCEEGELSWINKRELRSLNLWEGDHIFLDLLEQGTPFFSLKLQYQGERLIYAALNGEVIR